MTTRAERIRYAEDQLALSAGRTQEALREYGIALDTFHDYLDTDPAVAKIIRTEGYARPLRPDPRKPSATTAYLVIRDGRRDLTHWWGIFEANRKIADGYALEIIAMRSSYLEHLVRLAAEVADRWLTKAIPAQKGSHHR